MKTPLIPVLVLAFSGPAIGQNVLPDDYPNNPPGFMLPIAADGRASAAGRINFADDRDVFSFQVGANATLTVLTTGTTDTNGILKRQTNAGWVNVVTEEGGTGNFRISRAVEPGLYAISVGGKLSTTADPAGTVSGAYGLSVALTPTAVLTPDIDIPEIPRGGSVNFGSIASGTTATRTFTVRNAGQSNLVISGITASGSAANGGVVTTGPFLVDGGGARTLAPGASATIGVLFKPTAAGTFTALVSAVSNDPDENLYTFTVVGSATAPPPPVFGGEIGVALGNTDVPTGGTVDFGTLTIPSSATGATRELLISNTGDKDLQLGNVVISLVPTASPLPSAPDGFFRVLTPPAGILAPGRTTVLRLGAGANAAPVTTALRFYAYATFENSDADESPYRLLLSAEVKPTPPPAAGEIDVASGDAPLQNNGVLDFGTTPTGSPVRKVVTIKNSGEGELRLTAIAVEWAGPIIAIWPPPPTPFRVDGAEPRVVAPGATTSCTVVFPATTAGTAQALLRISSTDGDENPFILNLKAAAEGDPVPPTAPEIAVSLADADVPVGGTVDFGRTSLTVPVRKTLTIANRGTGPLQIRAGFQSAVRAANTLQPFRLSGEPIASVPAGATRPLTIVFQPLTNGPAQSMLVITNNDADENPYRIRLTGEGGSDPAAVPDIALNLGDTALPMGGTVDFGTAAPGTSLTKEIRITNSGQGDLKLGRVGFVTPVPGVNAAGVAVDDNGLVVLPPVGVLPFRVLTPANSIVPAGRSATLRLVYTAPPSGSQSAVLSIESNDLDESPWNLNLKGTSSGAATAAPEIAVAAGSADLPIGGTLDFGVIIAGSQSRREITISNSGTGDLRIAGFSIIPAEATANDALVFLPPPALVRVVSGPGVIAPGASGVFVLEMLAFSPGNAMLSARITNNDRDENPYSFRITGLISLPPVVDPPVVDPGVGPAGN